MLHWLASYPKSGNTWVRMLVGHYGELGAGEVEARHDDISRYWYQCVSPVPVDELSLGEEAQVRGAAIAHLQCFLSHPTLVKTHHACMKVNGVPLFTSQWCESVIYVVRDPRDIVASFRAHMGLETIDDAIDMMGNRASCISQDKLLTHVLGGWSFHVESWLDSKVTEPLVVRYEDLHEDAAQQLTRVLEHIGLEPDAARVEKAVELCRFERLKRNEDMADFPEKSPNQDRFFRRGEVGGHVDELTDAQVQRVESEHGEMMERLGYGLTSEPTAPTEV